MDGFLTYIDRHAQRSKESCDKQIARRKLRRIFLHLFPRIFKEDLLLVVSVEAVEYFLVYFYLHWQQLAQLQLR